MANNVDPDQTAIGILRVKGRDGKANSVNHDQALSDLG